MEADEAHLMNKSLGANKSPVVFKPKQTNNCCIPLLLHFVQGDCNGIVHYSTPCSCDSGPGALSSYKETRLYAHILILLSHRTNKFVHGCE